MLIKISLKTKNYLLLFLLLLGIFALSATFVQAGTIKYTPNMTIPGSQFIGGQEIDITPNSLAEYIKEIYRYAGVIAGAFAMFMLVYGAWQWLMAGGNASKVTMAKETVTTTLIGLAFLFGGYLLLSQISANLVIFQPLVIKEPNIVSPLVGCAQDSDCNDGYLCTHEVYLNNTEGAEQHCPTNIYTVQIEYLVAKCSDDGSSYDNVSSIEAKCVCREARLVSQDTQCRPLYLLDYPNICLSPYVSVIKDNGGCASYTSADDCRANICHNQATLSGTIFDPICGISLKAIEAHNPYEPGDCQQITDVKCLSNSDCLTGNEIGNIYCCADRNNLEDYCRLRSEVGVICKPD